MANRDYKRDARDITKNFGNKGYSPEQIANISQLLGRKGARDFFRSGKNSDIVGTLYANGGDLTDPKKRKKKAQKEVQQQKKDSLYVFTHNPKVPDRFVPATEELAIPIRKIFIARRMAEEHGGDPRDYLTITRDELNFVETYLRDNGLTPDSDDILDKIDKYRTTVYNPDISPYVEEREGGYSNEFIREFNRGKKALSRFYDVKAFHNKDSTDFKKNLKKIPKNSKVMLMDHTGSKLFGMKNKRIGQLLGEQEVETCIAGTCNAEGILGEIKGETPNTRFIGSRKEDFWEGFNVKGKDTMDVIFPKGKVEFANGGNLYQAGGSLGLIDPPITEPTNAGLEQTKARSLAWRAAPENVKRLRSNLAELGKDPKDAGRLTIENLLNIREAKFNPTGQTDTGGVRAETHGHEVDLHARANLIDAGHELEHVGGIDKPLSELIKKRYGNPFEASRSKFAESKGYTREEDGFGYITPEGRKLTTSEIDKEIYQSEGKSGAGIDQAIRQKRYLSQPGELYPRIQEIRQKLNIQPGQQVTPEMLEAVKGDEQTGTLFKYYKDEQIQDLLNTLAVNRGRNRGRNNAFNTVAALGGFIETI